MTKKIYYHIILFVSYIAFNNGCKSIKNYSDISSIIYSIQKQEFGDGIFVKGLSIYREQSRWMEKLNHSAKKDTIFILELPGIQGNYDFTFWNKKDTLSYTNFSGSFEFIKESLFTNEMMNLASRWDISIIKKKEDNSPKLLPSEFIYATRIIIKDGNLKIDCIRFKDFYD